MVFIATDRLELRPFEEGHITERYVGWLNDPEVCRYNGHHYFPYTKSGAYRYLESTSSDKSIIVLAVHLKETKEHIGNVSIGDIDLLNRSAALNILLGDKNQWGQGYAYEAFAALLEHSFSELNLNRVSCGTLDTNIGMQKVAQKLGMQKEGTKRSAIYKNGSYHSTIEYSIIKEEYMTMKADTQSL